MLSSGASAILRDEAGAEFSNHRGLILNEPMTNSLKHAFAEDRGGERKVVLRTTADRLVLLQVSDTGPACLRTFKPGDPAPSACSWSRTSLVKSAGGWRWVLDPGPGSTSRSEPPPASGPGPSPIRRAVASSVML
jgi:anti-sigma regulatory factor (Ser/Thr protein kinase)